jgi:hypothetical protein
LVGPRGGEVALKAASRSVVTVAIDSPAAGDGVDSCAFADAGVRGEQLLSESQTGLCTGVDICSNFIEKLQLPATFRPARRGFPIAKLDR